MENVYSVKKDDKQNVNDEYDLYEKRQIFLDNINIKSGNDILWIRDKDTVCLSKDRDNMIYYPEEVKDLPQNSKVRKRI